MPPGGFRRKQTFIDMIVNDRIWVGSGRKLAGHVERNYTDRLTVCQLHPTGEYAACREIGSIGGF